MLSDLDLKVLEFLNEKPNSVVAIVREFPVDFPDREKASITVNRLYKSSYILKQTNGWRTTEKAKRALGVPLSNKASEKMVQQITEELESDGGVLSGGVIASAELIPKAAPPADIAPDPFEALRVLAELVPSNAMFSIGKDSIILGSKKYRIEKPGDFEAVMRAEALAI